MAMLIETTDKVTNAEAALLGTPVRSGQGLELLDITPVSGLTNGEWVGTLKSWDKLSIGLYASADATFLVCGSDLVGRPDDSWDGMPLFYGNSGNLSPTAAYDGGKVGQVIITGGGEVILPYKIPVRWLKVKVLANTGLVAASLMGV